MLDAAPEGNIEDLRSPEGKRLEEFHSKIKKGEDINWTEFRHLKEDVETQAANNSAAVNAHYNKIIDEILVNNQDMMADIGAPKRKRGPR